MLDFLFSQVTSDTLTVSQALLTVLSSIILGLVISLTYMLVHKKVGYSSGFVITLIIVPAAIAVIILLIGSNVARAFSLAGALSLIRYRSEPGNPKDIAYLFFTLAIGLACGIGFIGYGAVFTVIFCLLMFVLDKIGFGEPKTHSMRLTITVPESLNYKNAFDDILEKYTDSFALAKVRTTEFGSMFELVFRIMLSEDADQKEFIDKLRERNGNLNITLSLKETDTVLRQI